MITEGAGWPSGVGRSWAPAGRGARTDRRGLPGRRPRPGRGRAARGHQDRPGRRRRPLLDLGLTTLRGEPRAGGRGQGRRGRRAAAGRPAALAPGRPAAAEQGRVRGSLGRPGRVGRLGPAGRRARRRRPARGRRRRRAGRLPVLLQASVDGDPERGGVPGDDLLPLADTSRTAPGCSSRGDGRGPAGCGSRAAFAGVAEAASRLRAAFPQAPTVSAGMSGDLEAADRARIHLRACRNGAARRAAVSLALIVDRSAAADRRGGRR